MTGSGQNVPWKEGYFCERVSFVQEISPINFTSLRGGMVNWERAAL